MGASKTDLFTAHENELARYAKALGHPARIAILGYLLDNDRCMTGLLVEELGLAQATISQHLKELKASGIIKGNIEGTSIRYCIDPKQWEAVKTLLCTFFDHPPIIDDEKC